MIELSNIHDDRLFMRLCRLFPDHRLERTARGDIIIGMPNGGRTGIRILDLCGQLWSWSESHDLGQAFNSSIGYRLPNGAIRSPSVSWISHERWNPQTREEWEAFPPLAPDFAAEVLDPSDTISRLRDKLEEYLSQGTRLGWLIDPARHVALVYRPGRKTATLVSPPTLSGEDVLPGFVLDMKDLFPCET
jgi:Uma2 family endonuclease